MREHYIIFDGRTEGDERVAIRVDSVAQEVVVYHPTALTPDQLADALVARFYTPPGHLYHDPKSDAQVLVDAQTIRDHWSNS